MPGIVSSAIALTATIAMSVHRYGVAQLAPWVAALGAVFVLRRATRRMTTRRIDAEVDANNGMIAYVQLCLQGASELGRGRAADYVIARTGDAAAEWAHAEIRRESVYRLRRAALLATFAAAGALTAVALGVHPERWTLSSLALLDAAWPAVLLPMALSLVHALDLASHSMRTIDVAGLGQRVPTRGTAPIPLDRGGEIRARDLVVRYGDSLALDRIEFRLPLDGVIVVVGPNAAGKSTLARALAGIVAPASGTLTVAGVEPASIAPDDIAYVPQQPAFLASRSVLENVLFTAPSLDRAAVEAGFARLRVDVEPDRLASALSGGQRRRVAVARALLRDPRLLVLDEADAGLDRDAREWLAETVRDAAADRVIVVVTHHPALFAFADSVIVLDERHRLVDHGSPAALETRCAAYRALVRADETFGSAGLEPDEAVLRGTG
jgi:ABC-type multidrug transport system ATPase subunit